jgi:hypothetical protein
VDGLANAVANLANDVEKHNASTPGRVKERIEHKRQKLYRSAKLTRLCSAKLTHYLERRIGGVVFLFQVVFFK